MSVKSARMSKIVWHRLCTHTATLGVKGLIVLLLLLIEFQFEVTVFLMTEALVDLFFIQRLYRLPVLSYNFTVFSLLYSVYFRLCERVVLHYLLYINNCK